MSVEDALRSLEEWKKRKEKDYIELKGVLKGFQMGKLNPLERSFVKLLEMMTKGFNNISDNIILAFELEIATIQKANSLETRIEELETNILQLRETLDKMFQAR